VRKLRLDLKPSPQTRFNDLLEVRPRRENVSPSQRMKGGENMIFEQKTKEVTNEMIYEKLEEILKTLKEIKEFLAELPTKRKINETEFLRALDHAISEVTGVVGWALLSEVEKKVTHKLELSREEFERMFVGIGDKIEDIYELAPGGIKQYTIRGKFYGLIKKK